MKITQVTYAAILAVVLISLPLAAAQMNWNGGKKDKSDNSKAMLPASAQANNVGGNGPGNSDDRDDDSDNRGKGNNQKVNTASDNRESGWDDDRDDDNYEDDDNNYYDSDDDCGWKGNKPCKESNGANRTVTTLGELTVITKVKGAITPDQQNTINSVLAALGNQTGRVKIDINSKNGKFHIDVDIGKSKRPCNNTTYNTTASISGTKFDDTNGNGVRDVTDSGLSGWVIYLDANNNSVYDSGEMITTTGANGNYNFSGLVAGNYTVREVQKTGWIKTTADQTIKLNRTGVTGVDFGNFKLGTISGTKFDDTNGNNVMNANETGLANWTITLTGPVNTTAATDANGTYSFTGLTAGTYTVAEVSRTGWTTAPNHTITVQSGTSADADFGNFKLGAISGTVFNDLNNTGVLDSNPGLANWTVVLTGPVNMTTQTDADGNYSFANIGPGSYAINETLQSNWTLTLPAGGYQITMTSGLAVNGKNFGNIQNV